MGQQILSHLENTQLSEQYLRELEKNLTPDDGKSLRGTLLYKYNLHMLQQFSVCSVSYSILF